jgi:hypothetical protein
MGRCQRPQPACLVLRADPLRAARQVPVAAQVSLAGTGVVLIAITSALAARLR